MQLAHRRTRRPFRGASRDRSRGAVLVEAAFITPVFLMLVFGIIEVGLAMNDSLALAHTVRAGSRVASASGNDPLADYGIVQAVKREGSALPDAQIVRVVVFKASRYGAAPSASCQAGTGIGTGDDACSVYTPEDFDLPKNRWGCQPTDPLEQWCPTSRKVTLAGTGPDYVGVWMMVEHRWVTQMFGEALTLTDSSVIRLEPRLKA